MILRRFRSSPERGDFFAPAMGVLSLEREMLVMATAIESKRIRIYLGIKSRQGYLALVAQSHACFRSSPVPTISSFGNPQPGTGRNVKKSYPRRNTKKPLITTVRAELWVKRKKKTKNASSA